MAIDSVQFNPFFSNVQTPWPSAGVTGTEGPSPKRVSWSPPTADTMRDRNGNPFSISQNEIRPNLSGGPVYTAGLGGTQNVGGLNLNMVV